MSLRQRYLIFRQALRLLLLAGCSAAAKDIPLETVDPGLDLFGQRVPGAVRHGHLARRADDTSLMVVTAGLGSVALALR